MHTILIIGAGQLGSRHLQGVLKNTTPLHVYVVDPSDASLHTAKERANEVEHAHTISFSTSLDASIQSIDVAIVATNANVREKVVTHLLETLHVKYLILEKVLFPDLTAYGNIGELIARKKISTWVNHPRRMYPIYQKIKNQLHDNNQAKIHATVNGNNWGLGCNGLHYIDLICFLNDTQVREIDTSLLDATIHESKRAGYIEFTGTLTVKFTCGSSLILTSFDGTPLQGNIVIQSHSFKWLIQEGGKAEVDFFQAGQAVKTEEIKPLFQSELSTTLIASILKEGKCELPSYSEAQAQHISFVTALLDFYQTTIGEKTTNLNIT